VVSLPRSNEPSRLTPGGDVAGEAPLRVFRYASASPFHLTRYETKQNKPTPKDPQKGSTNLTKYWQRKGDHFILHSINDLTILFAEMLVALLLHCFFFPTQR
jgi:hypothetical protein